MAKITIDYGDKTRVATYQVSYGVARAVDTLVKRNEVKPKGTTGNIYVDEFFDWNNEFLNG